MGNCYREIAHVEFVLERFERVVRDAENAVGPNDRSKRIMLERVFDGPRNGQCFDRRYDEHANLIIWSPDQDIALFKTLRKNLSNSPPDIRKTRRDLRKCLLGKLQDHGIFFSNDGRSSTLDRGDCSHLADRVTGITMEEFPLVDEDAEYTSYNEINVVVGSILFNQNLPLTHGLQDASIRDRLWKISNARNDSRSTQFVEKKCAAAVSFKTADQWGIARRQEGSPPSFRSRRDLNSHRRGRILFR